MQSQTTLDPVAALAALGYTNPSSVTPIDGGATTAIWRVEHDGQRYALRVFPPRLVHRFGHELAAMERASMGGVPVPTVHASGMYGDHPVMLIGWCEGRTLAAAIEAQPWRVWYWGVLFGRMQATIHQTPYQSEGEDWIGWAGENEPEIQARLRSLALKQRLIHLDYHLLNVLVDDHSITGVIDWTNAHSGDPCADVARTYTILCVEPLEPSPMRPLIRLALWVFTLAWWYGYGWRPSRERALLDAWAGAVMTHDLAPRVERAGSWWRPQHIEAIRHWAARQKRRALVTQGHPRS